MCTTKKNKKNS